MDSFCQVERRRDPNPPALAPKRGVEGAAVEVVPPKLKPPPWVVVDGAKLKADAAGVAPPPNKPPAEGVVRNPPVAGVAGWLIVTGGSSKGFAAAGAWLLDRCRCAGSSPRC